MFTGNAKLVSADERQRSCVGSKEGGAERGREGGRKEMNKEVGKVKEMDERECFLQNT